MFFFFSSILDGAEKENVYENKAFHFENWTREENKNLFEMFL